MTRSTAFGGTVTASASSLALLRDVVVAVVPDARVVTREQLPDLAAEEHGVLLLPVGLTRRGRSQRDSGVLDLVLSVLVQPVGAHALDDLERVLVGLDAAPGFALSPDDPGPELLQALGLPLAPAALVRADVPVALPAQRTQVVSEPLRATIGALRLLRGKVLGPGGVGLPHAAVRVQGAQGRVLCAADGSFSLPLVSPASSVDLLVEVKGRRFSTEVAVRDGVPVEVRCDRWESSC